MKLMRKELLGIVILLSLALTACGSDESTSGTTESVQESVSDTAEVDSDEATEAATEESAEDETVDVTSLGLDTDTMLAIYNDYETAWKTSQDSSATGEYTTEDLAAQEAYEVVTTAKIANKYGLSDDEAEQVYFYVISHYDELMAEKGADISNIQLNNNTLIDVTTSGGTLVIKAKITKLTSNEKIIDSCSDEVFDAIRDYGLDQYNEIQYWAVMDRSDGSEEKVISFTVPKSLIDQVVKGMNSERVIDNAQDIWIHQKLRIGTRFK